MRFCGHIPNSHRNKNLESINGFLAPKTWLYPSITGKKKPFFPTLNVMILQMVRNECIRFGGHVEVQVSYKILVLNIPKKFPILQNLPYFQEGLF
jgi:hypothetical protein